MSGSANLKFVGLDSNVFIYYFESNPDFSRPIKTLFKKLTSGKLRATTSIISLIEVLSFPSPPGVIKGITEGFITFSNVTILDVNQDIAIEAARIRRKYGYRLPDAVQIATASIARAQAFVTNDQRLKGFKELRVVFLKDL